MEENPSPWKQSRGRVPREAAEAKPFPVFLESDSGLLNQLKFSGVLHCIAWYLVSYVFLQMSTYALLEQMEPTTVATRRLFLKAFSN